MPHARFADRLGIFILSLISLCLLTPASAGESKAPSPLTIANFELSKTRLVCPDCRSDWKTILKSAGHPLVPDGKKLRGYIVMAKLDDKRLKVMTSKPGEDKSCTARSYVVEGYEDEGKRALPVRLRTAQEWSAKLGIDVAFNANFFKHAAGAEQFARIPCGEVTGIAKSGGKFFWPPEDRTDLLSEPIANNPDHESWALAFADGGLRILKPQSLSRMNSYQNVIAGTPLYIGYWDNPALADDHERKKARLGIGYLKDEKSALVLMIEGPETPESDVQGINSLALRILFRAFGAINAMALPGGEYAQVATPTGTKSQTEGRSLPVPVANHFGFRVVKPVSGMTAR